MPAFTADVPRGFQISRVGRSWALIVFALGCRSDALGIGADAVELQLWLGFSAPNSVAEYGHMTKKHACLRTRTRSGPWRAALQESKVETASLVADLALIPRESGGEGGIISKVSRREACDVQI